MWNDLIKIQMRCAVQIGAVENTMTGLADVSLGRCQLLGSAGSLDETLRGGDRLLWEGVIQGGLLAFWRWRGLNLLYVLCFHSWPSPGIIVLIQFDSGLDDASRSHVKCDGEILKKQKGYLSLFYNFFIVYDFYCCQSNQKSASNQPSDQPEIRLQSTWYLHGNQENCCIYKPAFIKAPHTDCKCLCGDCKYYNLHNLKQTQHSQFILLCAKCGFVEFCSVW